MTVLRYRAPKLHSGAAFALVFGEGTPEERRFPFGEHLEIGRFEPGCPETEGRLLLDDPIVSSRHCTISRGPDGRLFARDTSRNGTRVDGRRLIPNREEEIRPGQTLAVGAVAFRLHEMAGDEDVPAAPRIRGTQVAPSTGTVTVLVGDIRGYTGLLGSVPGEEIQTRVAAIFGRLERIVHARGGQVKEYQGDSILAFWESVDGASGADAACRAALELSRAVGEAARDPRRWPFPSPLHMDWAVTTGRVSVQVLGEDRPEELSMVGETVVLAYRLEKAADELTGSVLVCERTREEAAPDLVFRDLGALTLAGFPRPVRAFALLGAGDDPRTGTDMLERGSA